MAATGQWTALRAGDLREGPAAGARIGRADALAAAALVAVAVIMAFTAPMHGEHWWSESPRNALNAAFIRDLLLDFPISDPVGWAVAYYTQYPALTVLFYPPLVPAILALLFLVLPVSHAVAVVGMAGFYLAAALGAYALARRWLDAVGALGCALAFAAAPEVALWGRQIMLEVPMLAFVLWSTWFALRYCDRARPRDLYLAAALFVLALYCKQTAGYLAPALAMLILLERGAGLLRDRHAWIVLVLSVIGLVPLAVMQMKFGGFNVTTLVDRPDVDIDRGSWAGWLFYIDRLPEMIGWVPTVLAAAYLALAAALPRLRLPWREAAYFAAWLGLGYVVFSLIDLKEPRHFMIVLFPIVLAAGVLAARLVPGRYGSLPALALGIGVLAATLAWSPVPAIDGYNRAVAEVVARARPGDRVMFVGNRDGSFIFNLREQAPEKNLTVVRADKIFLDITIMREVGVTERAFDEAQIRAKLNRLGIRWVVALDDFWTDIGVMARLAETLRRPPFNEVAKVEVTANIPHKDKLLRVYRNDGPLADPPDPIEMNIGAAGRRIEGGTLEKD